jgi:hypothetical protein
MWNRSIFCRMNEIHTTGGLQVWLKKWANEVTKLRMIGGVGSIIPLASWLSCWRGLLALSAG